MDRGCPKPRPDELHTLPWAWRSKGRIGVPETVLQDVRLSVRQRIGGFSITDREDQEQCHEKQCTCWLTDLHPASFTRFSIGHCPIGLWRTASSRLVV